MKFRPTDDRIIVKPVDTGGMTKGGLYLPDTAQEPPQEGVVVAVGPGRFLDFGKRLQMEVKAGDRIIYSRHGGIEVDIDGEKYLIMRQTEVLMILDS